MLVSFVTTAVRIPALTPQLYQDGSRNAARRKSSRDQPGDTPNEAPIIVQAAEGE